MKFSLELDFFAPLCFIVLSLATSYKDIESAQYQLLLAIALIGLSKV